MINEDKIVIESKDNNGNGDVTLAEYMRRNDDSIEWTCFERDKTYDADTAISMIMEQIKQVYIENDRIKTDNNNAIPEIAIINVREDDKQ